MSIKVLNDSLHQAIWECDLKRMEELILRDPGCLYQNDHNGSSALDNAVQSEHVEALRLLVQHGINMNAQEKELGITSLQVAARDGHLKTLNELLVCGADVYLADHAGRDPMILAIICGPRIDIIDALISGGVDINHRPDYPLGYLSAAVQMAEGFEKAVIHLLKYRIGDESLSEALELAEKLNKDPVVNLLKEYQLAQQEQGLLSEVVEAIKQPEKQPETPGRSSSTIRI